MHKYTQTFVAEFGNTLERIKHAVTVTKRIHSLYKIQKNVTLQGELGLCVNLVITTKRPQLGAPEPPSTLEAPTAVFNCFSFSKQCSWWGKRCCLQRLWPQAGVNPDLNALFSSQHFTILLPRSINPKKNEISAAEKCSQEEGELSVSNAHFCFFSRSDSRKGKKRMCLRGKGRSLTPISYGLSPGRSAPFVW